MAKSSNKRKNGKRVEHSVKKRMVRGLANDLNGLIIINIVDRAEIDGQSKSVPRSLVWDTKKGKEVAITKLQEHALKKERWNWDVYTAIVVREDGIVSLTSEDGFISNTPCLQTELSGDLVDKIVDDFDRVGDNALTMIWAMTPYAMPLELDLKMIVYSLFRWNVLGNMLTKREIDEDIPVVHYRAEKFDDFFHWYENQVRYKELTTQRKRVSLMFFVNDEPLVKGELGAFRDRLLKAGFDFVKNKRAYLKEWYGLAFENTVLTGKQTSTLLNILEQMPRCLKAELSVHYFEDIDDNSTALGSAYYLTIEKGKTKFVKNRYC